MADTDTRTEVLRVLVLMRETTSTMMKTILDVIRNDFHSRVEIVTNPSNIAKSYYDLLPYFMVLDTGAETMCERLESGVNVPDEISSIPLLLALHDEGYEVDLPSSPLTVYGIVGPAIDRERIINVSETVVEKVGFEVKDGKIKDRLVQRPLHVKITVNNMDVELTGETTGINKNGLGARLNPAKEDTSLDQCEGESCTVYFTDQDLGFVPAEGKILRVEDSWDDNYESFMAVRFNPNTGFGSDLGSLEVLESLIEQQTDESVRNTSHRQRDE
ncbi:MAG: hypothetical protein ABEJ65_11680 [bacterium]